MRRVLLATVLVWLAAIPTAPQTVTLTTASPTGTDLARDLGGYVDNLSKEDNFSGAILIAKDGKAVFQRAYGLANWSTKAPNNIETKFNLGSMNKMFTAVAVAQLVERGKLTFDGKIAKYLPDYPNRSIADSVTIHQLLTHTSGLGNYQTEEFMRQLDQIKTIADLLPFFVDQPLTFEPGAKWQYSNAGYAVLGLIIERVTGQSYFEYVRKNIFLPAGMSNTDSYERGAAVPNLALGYTRMLRVGAPDPAAPRRENTDTRPLKGSSAGGGYSTVEDLLKFVTALLNNQLVSKKYTDIITTGKFEVGGIIGKYAYGFGDKIFNGTRIVGHNGGGPGIAANLDIFPELGYVVIILTNYDPPSMFPVVMKARELVPSSSSSSTTSLAPTVSREAPPLSQAEREVRLLERQWLDAYQKRDSEAMKRILADDFKLTFPGGKVQTKAEVVSQLEAERAAGAAQALFSTDQVRSQVEGATVTLTGRVTQRMNGEGSRRSMQMGYRDTYQRRQGRWQVVSSQMFPVPVP